MVVKSGTGLERFDTVSGARARIAEARRAGKRIGFLATMGALHEGHLSLARTLTEHSDFRVVSIFVNPTQFNDPKDYQAYAINLAEDAAKLEAERVDMLFAPPASEIYPPGFQTTVELSDVTRLFEGEFRPGHFAGVATVVAMLFNIISPDVTIFGEKDFQQLRLVESMVKDLKLPIEIIRGTLIRDADGLALSSRNARLTAAQRIAALGISRGLFAARAAFEAGERRAETIEAIVRAEVAKIPEHEVDYIAVANEASVDRVDVIDAPARILVVVRVGGVRLLDNVALHP